LAATGLPRRFATLIATIALLSPVVAGCGGGDSQTVKAPTSPPPGVQKTSAPAFVGKLEKDGSGQIARLCTVNKAKGKDAAFAYFKKGYELAFPDQALSPKQVFDEILKHCD
jgi:hypothetical protein